MIETKPRETYDSQFKQLKKISKEISKKLDLDLRDVESFILKQEFFRALLYRENIDFFVDDFIQFLHAKMHLLPKESREHALKKRIYGRL